MFKLYYKYNSLCCKSLTRLFITQMNKNDKTKLQFVYPAQIKYSYYFCLLLCQYIICHVNVDNWQLLNNILTTNYFSLNSVIYSYLKIQSSSIFVKITTASLHSHLQGNKNIAN